MPSSIHPTQSSDPPIPNTPYSSPPPAPSPPSSSSPAHPPATSEAIRTFLGSLDVGLAGIGGNAFGNGGTGSRTLCARIGLRSQVGSYHIL